MTLVWNLWFFGGFGLLAASFAVLETYALRTGRKTLSRHVHDACKAWPLLTFILGFAWGGLISGLAVHLFWHWCPDLGLGIG